MDQKFMSADEVAEVLSVSKNKAYGIIRELNEELAKQGFMFIAGRVSRKYFNKKFYGVDDQNA